MSWESFAQCLLVQLSAWQKLGYAISSKLKRRVLEDCMQRHEYKAPRLSSESWSRQLEDLLWWYAEKFKSVSRHPCSTCKTEGDVAKVAKLCNVFECSSCAKKRLADSAARKYFNPDYIESVSVDEFFEKYWCDAVASFGPAAIDCDVDTADIAPALDDVGVTAQRLDSPPKEDNICEDSGKCSDASISSFISATIKEPLMPAGSRVTPTSDSEGDLFAYVPETPSVLHRTDSLTGNVADSDNVELMQADCKDFIFCSQPIGRGSFGQVYEATQIS